MTTNMDESLTFNVLEDDIPESIGDVQPRSIANSYYNQRFGGSVSSPSKGQYVKAQRRRSSTSFGDFSMDFSVNVAPYEAKEGMVVGVAANRPHPSLEYPPLYFLLKRFPRMFNGIKSAYK